MEKLGPFLANVHRGKLHFYLFTIISRVTCMDYRDFCNVSLTLYLPHAIAFLMCTRRYVRLSSGKKPDRRKQYIFYAKDIDRPSLESWISLQKCSFNCGVALVTIVSSKTSMTKLAPPLETCLIRQVPSIIFRMIINVIAITSRLLGWFVGYESCGLSCAHTSSKIWYSMQIETQRSITWPQRVVTFSDTKRQSSPLVPQSSDPISQKKR